MFKVGDRVIRQRPDPRLDGLRGTVTELWATRGMAYVCWDTAPDSEGWFWFSKLTLEIYAPDYPLPEKGETP